MKKKDPINRITALFEKEKVDKTLGKNIPMMLKNKAEKFPDVTLQIVKNEVGDFDSFTYERVYHRVIDLAGELKKLGIKRGDHIGMIADNRREWLISDLAVLVLGASDVPRGCDSMGTEIRFILNFTECKVAFFENQKQLIKLFEDESSIPKLEYAILFDSPDKEIINTALNYGIKVLKYIELEDDGKKATIKYRKEIEAEIDKTNPDDIATIIFTSGTTGTPKGVMLTHDCYMAQSEVLGSTFHNPKAGTVWLSILPVWHSFERVIEYGIIAMTNSIAYSKPAVSYMISDMKKIHPCWICGVPRLWESFTSAFEKKMKNSGKMYYMFYQIALSMGTSYHWAKDRFLGLRCRYKNTFRILESIASFFPFVIFWPGNFICELLFFRNIRNLFGGKLVALVSGGSALSPAIDAYYTATGFKLLECYGMTETGPLLSMRDLYFPRTGCVGTVLASVDVNVFPLKEGKVLEEKPLSPGKRGLVVAHGRQIMKGYYKREDLTHAVISDTGWMNTGDIGMMTQDNEIKIIGRAKDTIVLSGGENIEPKVIEQALCKSSYIDRTVLVGQNKKYIAALIIPSKEVILHYAEENRLMYANYENLLETSEIQKLIRDEIGLYVNASKGFRNCERIYKFVLLSNSFTVGKELNNKMDIKRQSIEKMYAHAIKKLYK